MSARVAKLEAAIAARRAELERLRSANQRAFEGVRTDRGMAGTPATDVITPLVILMTTFFVGAFAGDVAAHPIPADAVVSTPSATPAVTTAIARGAVWTPAPEPVTSTPLEDASAEILVRRVNVHECFAHPSMIEGRGDVAVTFGPDGRVTKVVIPKPWAGTVVEGCFERQFAAVVAPATGRTRTLTRALRVGQLRCGTADATRQARAAAEAAKAR